VYYCSIKVILESVKEASGSSRYAKRCYRHYAESNCKAGADWNMHNGMLMFHTSAHIKAVLKFTASVNS